MKEYIVPFSTREETPFVLGLTIREMLWIGGGLFIGFVMAVIVFLIIGVELKNIIFCIPVTIPFVGVTFYLAKKKVTEDDHEETLDRHLFKKFKYSIRPHKYLNYRRR